MPSNSLKATLPSLQSMKVPREPILITENEGEKFFFRASRGTIATISTSISLPSIRQRYHSNQPPHPYRELPTALKAVFSQKVSWLFDHTILLEYPGLSCDYGISHLHH